MRAPHSKFILPPAAAHDAALVRAALVAEKCGLKCVYRHREELELPGVVVVPDEFMEDAGTYGALAALAGTSGATLRAASERPAVSVEIARSRGFTDDEIRTALFPGLALGIEASKIAVRDAEKRLAAAQEDLANVRASAAAPIEVLVGSPARTSPTP